MSPVLGEGRAVEPKDIPRSIQLAQHASMLFSAVIFIIGIVAAMFYSALGY